MFCQDENPFRSYKTSTEVIDLAVIVHDQFQRLVGPKTCATSAAPTGRVKQSALVELV